MGRRMRSSWGCVQRLDAGRYRLRFWADLGDGYRRRTEVVRGSRREAEARLAELRVAHERQPGAPVDRRPVATVGYAWEHWHAPGCERRVEEGDLAPATWKNACVVWRLHVAPRWADVRCDGVKPLDVQEWLRGMTPAVARLAKIVLGQVLDRAVMYGACATNPAKMRYTMPSGPTGSDRGVYTLDELGEVLRAVRGSVAEPAVILMGFGSCRVGESLGVTASEVELRDVGGVPVALAPVARQVTHDGTVTDRLKNPQSRRVAVVAGPVGARLARLAREAMERGDRWLCDSGVGMPVSQTTLAKAWRLALDGAGLERHPLKSLRTSWETNAHWALRMDPAMIEPMMGHAGKTVTARHYDRPDVDMYAQAAADAYRAHPFAESWDYLGHDGT